MKTKKRVNAKLVQYLKYVLTQITLCVNFYMIKNVVFLTLKFRLKRNVLYISI